MDYKVRSFDDQKGSLLVEFIGHGFYNIDIPIVNNAFISGNDLEQYIQG